MAQGQGQEIMVAPTRAHPVTRTYGRNPDSHAARRGIKAGYIIGRLMMHFDGQIVLTDSQIKVGFGLLNKSLPDLVRAELAGEFTHRYVIEAPRKLTEEQWIQKHSPPMIENDSPASP